MLLLLLMRPAAVQAQFNYSVHQGEVTITGYSGPDGAVTIPDTIEGLPVTSIGDAAFYGRSSLTGVTIPNRVTNIGPWSFSGCTGLTSMVIPNRVTSIGDGAFSGCASLTSVTIPNSVTCIGYELIDVPGPPDPVGAFSYCISLTSVVIPDSVTNVGYSTFAGCTSLTSVKIGNGLAGIPGQMSVGGHGGSYFVGRGMFRGCTALTNVTIPSSVTSIGQYAFAGCTSLTRVTVGKSVTGIAGRVCRELFNPTGPPILDCPGPTGAFSGCSNLAGVYFEGDAPGLLGTLGWGVLEGADKATLYYLPGATGWGPTFDGRPTAIWQPHLGDSKVADNRFSFTVIWVCGRTVVVEACMNLAQAVWSTVSTNTLADGTATFTDPDWAQYPARFYRVRQQ